MEFLNENFLLNCLLKIILSAAFGIILGIERKNHLQAIGIRTLFLISISCALMGILSAYAASQNINNLGDPTRIAAGVITGVGFIGGGTILHQGFNIKGITTAAVIWATATLGLAIGHGLYLPSVFAFVLFIIGLPIFEKIEEKFFPAAKIKTIRLSYQSDEADIQLVKKIITDSGIIVRDENFSQSFTDDKLKLAILVNAPDNIDFAAIGKKFKETGDLIKFVID